jgi:hypothetical protein
MAILYVVKRSESSSYKVGLSKHMRTRGTHFALPPGPYEGMTQVVAEHQLPAEGGRACEAAVHAALAWCRDGARDRFRHENQADFAQLVQGALSEHISQVARAQIVRECSLSGSDGELVHVGSLPPPMLQALRDRAALARETHRLGLQQALLDDALKFAFSSRAGLMGEGGPILQWDIVNCNAFDLDRFRQENPQLAAQYSSVRTQKRARWGSMPDGAV